MLAIQWTVILKDIAMIISYQGEKKKNKKKKQWRSRRDSAVNESD